MYEDFFEEINEKLDEVRKSMENFSLKITSDLQDKSLFDTCNKIYQRLSSQHRESRKSIREYINNPCDVDSSLHKSRILSLKRNISDMEYELTDLAATFEFSIRNQKIVDERLQREKNQHRVNWGQIGLAVVMAFATIVQACYMKKQVDFQESQSTQALQVVQKERVIYAKDLLYSQCNISMSCEP